MISNTFLLLFLSFTFAVVTLQTEMAISADDPVDPDPGRTKRAANCAPKFQAFPGHSACLPGSDSSAVSKEEQTIVVDTHNNFRTKASPPAANMMLLRWDDEIAMVAQKWADNCEFEHDKLRGIPGRFKVGQNIALGHASFTDAITDWYNEVTSFSYGVGSTGGVTGHFTQMLWATTSLVGCGVQTCNSRKMYVCNYAPAGNLEDTLSTPWKAGEWCQDCKAHCFQSKLCDCGQTCLNEGTLDMESCSCDCRFSYFKQPLCSLTCNKAQDNPMCSTVDEDSCTYMGTICPNKCKQCPFAGIEYDGAEGGNMDAKSGNMGPGTNEGAEGGNMDAKGGNMGPGTNEGAEGGNMDLTSQNPDSTSKGSRLLQSKLSACICIIAWCRSLAYFLTSLTTYPNLLVPM